MNNDGWKKYKKVVLTKAKKMDEPFVIETLEGNMRGNEGDYLCQGIYGEYWPVKGWIFEKTYMVEESEEEE